MIYHVLVAYDASPASKKALDVAADLARRYEAELTIIHVIRRMQLPDEAWGLAEVERVAGERVEVLRHVASRMLKEAAERAKAQGVEKVGTATAEGDPATEITRYAKSNRVDLIVMGSRGLGEIKGMFLGSVSRKVSYMSEINCMTVH